MDLHICSILDNTSTQLNTQDLLSSTPSVDNTVSPSLLASIPPVCNISMTGRQKQSGSCPVCFRQMSITSAGVIHKHGLPSNPCAGSGCVPAVPVTATTSVALSNQSTTSSVTSVGASTNNQRNTQVNSAQKSTDILEILRMHRCRVLKRVPKASRIPAADKLADTLRHVISDPDNLDRWIKLLLFIFSCFSVPGQWTMWW